jgi:hypothetical protein
MKKEEAGTLNKGKNCEHDGISLLDEELSILLGMRSKKE